MLELGVELLNQILMPVRDNLKTNGWLDVTFCSPKKTIAATEVPEPAGSTRPASVRPNFRPTDVPFNALAFA